MNAPAPVLAATAAALVDVLMPQMGTSVVEGTIVDWRVAVGGAIAADETICEISTDKVDSECPAPATGVLAEILVPTGETVDVGTVIGRIAVGGAPAVAAPATDGPPTTNRDAPGRREVLRSSSPVAARIADEHGLDVTRMTGSGRNGRVTKRDVLRAVAEGGAPTADGAAPAEPDEAPMHIESPYVADPGLRVAGAPVAPAAQPGPAAPRPAVPPTSAGSKAPAAAAAARSPGPGSASPPTVPDDLGGVAVPMTRMRTAIGAAMRRSLDTAAHATTIVECDMTLIERRRRELGVTALPLLARHAVDALREFPALNATFDGETVTRYDRVHLGIAVSLGEDGLIVPVIHDAQDLAPEGVARRIRDVAVRARERLLGPDEVRGGTFTITNPGASGAVMATPVINVPQVAILDLEAIVRRPVVVTDEHGGESIAIRPMVNLCMSWDHRVLDGVYAARFLTALRHRVEGR